MENSSIGEEPKPKIREAAEVFLYMHRIFRASRNLRAHWYIDHLGKTVKIQKVPEPTSSGNSKKKSGNLEDLESDFRAENAENAENSRDFRYFECPKPPKPEDSDSEDSEDSEDEQSGNSRFLGQKPSKSPDFRNSKAPKRLETSPDAPESTRSSKSTSSDGKKRKKGDEYGQEMTVVGIVPAGGDGTEIVENEEEFLVTVNTKCTYISRYYRIVFVLDLSPSVVVADDESNCCLVDRVIPSLRNSLRSSVKPFIIPGTRNVFRPQVFSSVCLFTPFMKFEETFTLCQGVFVTESNVDQVIENVEVKFVEIYKNLFTFSRPILELWGKLKRRHKHNKFDSLCENESDERTRREAVKQRNLTILLASGYIGIYHGHLDMEVPYQGIREILRFFWHPGIWGYILGIWIWKYHIKASEKSCDSSGIRVYGDISWASGYGSTISRHQRNLAILLASGYMGIYLGHLDMEVPYQGIREILRFFWHPGIWGYIMGIWIWKYHIKASEKSCDSSGIRIYRDTSWASGYGSTISRHQRNLAILLASGYIGIYHGHLDMEVPYQGIRGILRFFWHPDIWGYIMGIWIWEYHIKASEESCDSSGIRIYRDISWASGYGSTISRHQRNLTILLASGYIGIYHGHLDMEVPYQGIREILRFFWHPEKSCDSSGIRVYGDISWASGYGSTISRHQRNLAILLASGYIGIHLGHLDMEVPYQGIREILRFFWHPGIWDISWASGYGSTISRHQRNLAILLASGYMGIYHGHLDMEVPYQGIREILRFFWHPGIWGYIMGIWIWKYHIKASEKSCDSSGIRIYGDISWASGYGSTISRHQKILRFIWHPDIWGYIMGIWIWKYHIKASEESCDSSGIRIYRDISWASGYGSTISRHQKILRFFWHPDIWGYIMGIWIWKYHIEASENLAIHLASGYIGIYHGHLDMEVPYQGIRKSCDSSGIRIYRDISWASGYGSTISRHQKILRFFWHPDIWGYIMGIWIWKYHIKASEESCDSSGIRIYRDISWASGYGSTISRHQKILRFFWHPDIWGYIMGIWIWKYHIKASEESCDSSGIRIYRDISWASGYGSTISRHQRNLAILLASGYMGIYHGHLDMEVPYQGIREILRFFWHPGIWGYIMGIWIWKYHIKASEESCDSSGIRVYGDISWASGYGSTISRHQRNLAILLASGYMGIYHGHLDMEVPYQGIREILRFFWHPDIWGYIMGIWIWKYHIEASENLAIHLASGYMGIYHGHLDMEVPYQGIRKSCDSSGIRIYRDISWASGYGSTISRHQKILRFIWHPDIWGYIMGIWIWKYHIKASEKSYDSSGIRIYRDISWASGYGSTISRHQRNLAILLASGYIGIYHGHLDMEVPYQGIREILRFFWHPDI
ncbi:hypothetical protein B9Z55_004241 [Caenorhabditis nigoni]|uniref:Uncharacterized protein n=1 Tax=Caenorhabditis nigoni TaxID=1611254 RepID=A0A2G5UW08_9PELO|nr:hypothetical protein B9Z55_004241 [Caenorhabditis nigoni]